MEIVSNKKRRYEWFKNSFCLVSGFRRKATAALVLGALSLASSASVCAQTLTTLHSFDYTDGEFPVGAVVQATNGNLYGTTEYGGANGYGTVFKITPGGTLTTLHSFDYTDGATPEARLIQATDGNLYGTTGGGGASDYGTVFKITPGGTLTTLHSFDYTDGASPLALVQASDGNFYGTTAYGGVNGDGTVFKITRGGTLTTLHIFDGTDGEKPQADELVQATDGNLYGTTGTGGANGYGTVFKITPGGTLTTLYSFCSQGGCVDGTNPYAGLVQAADGNFYGTTAYGGITLSCAYGCGTVFRITPSGMLTTLHEFCSLGGTCGDGEFPQGTLVQGTDGSLRGTTTSGGTSTACEFGCGVIFSVSPTGGFGGSSSFDFTDGAFPYGGLIQDTNGEFYGTTRSGGAGTECASNCGTVFSYSAGLGPFVETQPTSGKVGATVKILGTNLTGATSVRFNGTAATFIVTSNSLITTAVPTGATTGTVQVVTPHATLSSNVPFRVRP